MSTATTAPRSYYVETSQEAHEIVMNVPVPAFRFVGKCKTCKTKVAVERVTRWVTKHNRYDGIAVLRESAGTERTDGCPNGCGIMRFRLVKGTYNADHACDARCLNAFGPNCECACGGESHGAGNVPVTA